ncbi:DUF305 domain-containing protein [Microcella frigidaquae]|uniref:Uncharacterized protein (DUF305 family) n=1 Tax=Microcella frigidaquae TaxID=424758 RepID=A0A840XBC6_9MICO|nr:DUF305 domain-containing protein [Microcella frigidaquae]MBB5618355.1 uncharacterized protein (DUF305 family) [Microcella frigidaquae]NHN44741.1 DUF305 domain-containing protein [Microcella frigidaquae]
MTGEGTATATAGGDSPGAVPSLSRTRLAVVGVLLVLVALVAGVLLGRLSSGAPAPMPSDSSAEAGFARDMQVHHGQAVEMALLVRDRSDDAEIRLLALDIATAQTQQQGQMFAWLAMWGLPQTSTAPEMEWLSRPVIDGSAGHDGHGAHVPGEPMPGVATFEQMQALQDATGVEAERIFLELMIAHHQGGVEMAEAVLARSDNPQVRALAEGMVQLQQKELDYMAELLAARS